MEPNSPETNPHIYGLFMTKPRTCKSEKRVSSINGKGKTGQPHPNKWNIILYHTQNLTQSGLKTETQDLKS